jgi:hypothetical protein
MPVDANGVEIVAPVQTPVQGVAPVATTPVQTPEQIAAAALVAAPVSTPAPVSTTDTKGVVTFEPTGDAGLDLSLGFFGKLGLGMDSPELVEAGKGNFEYLEAKLKSMGDKAAGWEAYLNLGKDAYKRLETDNKTQYESRKKLVHDAVGGEDNWNKIVEYVNANAEPNEKEEVTKALQQGGMVAKAMALMLHSQFLGAPGTELDPANPVRTQETAPAGGAPLTLAGYQGELQKLVSKYGSHQLDDRPEYAQLRKRYANVRA